MPVIEDQITEPSAA